MQLANEQSVNTRSYAWSIGLRLLYRQFIFVAVLTALAHPAIAHEPLNVAPNPGFEAAASDFLGWYPVGVTSEDGHRGTAIDGTVARTGQHSLKITPGPATPGFEFFPSHNGGEEHRPAAMPGTVRGVRTFAMRLEPDVVRVNAAGWVRKPPDANLHISLVWTARNERKPVVEVAHQIASTATRSENDWHLYEISADRPAAADRVQLIFEMDPTTPYHLDDVQLQFHLRPHVELLVDQLGYEPDSTTKIIVLQSTTPLPQLENARLVEADTGHTVRQLSWQPLGLLTEWDRYHWRADFSEFRAPGRYRVECLANDATIRSPEFTIADHLWIDRAIRPAYRFYYYQRCGCEVPGFHAACHLDDARLPDGTTRDLAGGWHDAGDYNKYNGLTPETVHLLAYAYHRNPELFNRWDEDHNGRADILDEALWGARFLRKAFDVQRGEIVNAVYTGYRYWGPPEKETDNRPGTGDERHVRPGAGDSSHCVAAFALVGAALATPTSTAATSAAPTSNSDSQFGRELVTLAEHLYDNTGGGIDRLIPLSQATGNSRYRKLAETRARELLATPTENQLAAFHELAEYALAFPNDPLVAKIRPIAEKRVAQLTALCDTRFGLVHETSNAGRPIYFKPYRDVNDWYVGDSSQRLDAAIDALYAARLGAHGGRAIAEQQIHWLLGCNPFGISYMEGVGSRFVAAYHHRYNTIPGNPRGAVPGALINGMVRPWPHTDRPWLDLVAEPNADYHSNEPWLLHNNRWLWLATLW